MNQPINFKELNRMNSLGIKMFMTLKLLVHIDQNEREEIEEAGQSFNYLEEQLALDDPDDEGIMEKVEILCSVHGIESYMDSYKGIIKRHLEAIRS